MIEFLALMLLVAIPLYATLLALYAYGRRRRGQRSWRDWHRRQAGRAFAWRRFFGGERHLRLTHTKSLEVD